MRPFAHIYTQSLYTSYIKLHTIYNFIPNKVRAKLTEKSDHQILSIV